MKIKPFPHQVEAIESTLKTFKKHDRCHIVMACGTGKTYTAFNITKQLAPENVTIFVPSLALINQFLKSWTSCINTPHKILVICSDKNVLDDKENDSFAPEQINYPVTSEPGEIRSFIKAKNNFFKIIFCTYQSASLLGQALNGDKLLDFGIYDEAHKTAGYEKTTLSYALHDENIYFKRRLFMTATPRHGKPRIKATGEEVTLFSMDNKELYGPRAYTLPFREAINRGLICNYKIIISCIAKDTSHKFNQEYEFQEKSQSLKEAIDKSGAKKIITFHSSIAHAKNFANFLKKYKVHDNQLHINAELGMDYRHQVMSKFKTSEKSVITNSKCLTEGVDVPSVDMVAFLNPKSSKIDIVQAIGRALRNSPGKKYGYIFLPLLVTNPDNLENEIQGSEFKAIWEVLNALMEQDSELADSVKFLSRKGGGETWKGDPLENFFSFGRNKVSKEIKKLIKVKILHKLLPAWDIMYERLAEHYYNTGSTYLSSKHPDKELMRWCQRQREAKNTMSEEKANLLDEINFIWVAKEVKPMISWDESFENLKMHMQKFNLPPTFTSDKRLYNWMNAQRVYFNQNKLPQEKADKLKSIGIELERYVSRSQILQPNTTTSNRVVINYNLAWQDKFEELKAYKARFGTTHVPQRGEYSKLGKWVCCQREDYKANRITPTRKDLLKSIGFIFEAVENIWDTRLKEFANSGNGTKSESLKNWITYQREQFRMGKLSPSKIDKLKAVNFNFQYAAGRFSYAHDPINKHPKFKALLAKYNKQKSWSSGKHDPLYDFLKHIRENFRSGKLNKESIKILNTYRFVWQPEGGVVKRAKTNE